MRTLMMGLLAETPLHPGAGQSLGAIDLPVARESTTGYPVIVGSSLKGALKDKAEQAGLSGEEVDAFFGKQVNAGAAAITDARLLLLPVRSLNGHFRWVACPYLLERLKRDALLAGFSVDFEISPVQRGEAIAADSPGTLFLEELSFKAIPNDQAIAQIANGLAPLVKHPATIARLVNQLVIIHDDDFSHFASYGLQVSAHNQLNRETKTSENLWYSEEIPTDSLLYALVIARSGLEERLGWIKRLFEARPYLQVGGDETIGRGWCAISIRD